MERRGREASKRGKEKVKKGHLVASLCTLTELCLELFLVFLFIFRNSSNGVVILGNLEPAGKKRQNLDSILTETEIFY